MLEQLLSTYPQEAAKTAFLLQLVKEHPYFTPAQFCLLQQTAPEAPAYAQRAAVTSMLFGNAGWLNYQLNNGFAAAARPQVTEATPPAEAELPVAEAHTEAATAEAAEPVAAVNTEALEAITTVNAEVAAPLAAAGTAAITETGSSNAENGEKTGSEMPQPAIPGPKPHQPAGDDLLFEPLYAVDYFASQGIKLSDEVQPGDKLGRQLKSFTEWLKSMKKTHPADTAESEEGPAGSTIQQIAEKSNTEDAVITEAMADVYVLQGNRTRAVAIYRKLSLLNPSKSAYFAAKIENLK